MPLCWAVLHFSTLTYIQTGIHAYVHIPYQALPDQTIHTFYMFVRLACLHVYMLVWHVCILTWWRFYNFLAIRPYIYTVAHASMHVYIIMCTSMHVYIHACIHPCMYTPMHVYIHACIHLCMYTSMDVIHLYAHTYAHACTHTHIVFFGVYTYRC